MSLPPNYTPTTSFADDESLQAAGRSTVRTAALDQEFADIEATTDALIANQRLIQRDDGKLLDLSVEPYALGEQTRAMMAAAGGNPRGAWAQNTNYAVKDLVQNAGIAYMCQTVHNSGPTFNAGFWIAISGDGSAAASAAAAAASAAEAQDDANAAEAAAAGAIASAASADESADLAAAAQLAAQNAADSIAGLSPVSLSALMLDFLGSNTAAAARAEIGALGLTDAATQAEAEAGTSNAKLMTPLAASQTLKGHQIDLLGNTKKASVVTRFGDTVHLVHDLGFNPSGADASAATNNAALDAWIAHATANPNKTYRARKGDVFRITATGKVLPSNLRIASEGARWRWSGDLSGSGANVLTFGSGTTADMVAFDVVAGSNWRRLVLFSGNSAISEAELMAESYAGVYNNNLDAAFKCSGSDIYFGKIKFRNLFIPVMFRGLGGPTPDENVVIDSIDGKGYGKGCTFQNIKGLRLRGGWIRGQGPGALPDPGYNALGFSSIVDCVASGFILEDSAEHGFRLGGNGAGEQTSRAINCKGWIIRNTGQSCFKTFTGTEGEWYDDITLDDIQVFNPRARTGAGGFNDFGFMLQQLRNSRARGLSCVVEGANPYDGAYISQCNQFTVDGYQFIQSSGIAARNALRISELNGPGGTAHDINSVSVKNIYANGHVAEGVYIECATASVRDMYLHGQILGGTDGIRFAGAAARAAQPNYFEAMVRGHSGVKFNVPGTTDIKTRDMLA